jgi:uncharacterized membrane-anchored protein
VTDAQKVALGKVPEITLGFWIIKIFATTLGEVGGNAVTMTLGFGYLIGTVIFAVLLIVVVSAQIVTRRFHPFLYWSVITATTLTGTTLADFFDRSLGIGYLGGSLSLFTLVIASLGLWQWTLGSVAVQTVTSPKVKRSIGRQLCSRRRSARHLATGWPMTPGLATMAARLLLPLH